MLNRIVLLGAIIAAGVAGCSEEENGGEGNTAATGVGASGSGLGGDGMGLGGDGMVGTGSTGLGTGSTGLGTGSTGVVGTGSTGSGTGSTGSGTGSTGSGTAGTGGSSFVECEAVWTDTQSAPAILMFVIDKSTSMNDSSESTGTLTKWEATRDALIAAWNSMPPDLAVGEFFYPNQQDGCVQEDVGGVPIAPLDATQVAALVAGVEAVANPTNPAGTPTHDAWREGVRQLAAVLANPPTGYDSAKGYIVLVTDGMPVKTLNCGAAAGNNIAVTEEQFNEIITDVDNIATTTGLETFVIGVPGSELTNQVPTDESGELDYLPQTKLSELAIAGLTAEAGCSTAGPNYCHIDMTNPEIDFVEELTAVIGEIATSVASCEYPVPELTDDTMIVDPGNPLQVAYYANGGTTPALLTRSVGCADGMGWDYADASETSIVLCTNACATVQADSLAQVKVSLGCIPVG